MGDGILLVDKPVGFSSFQVVRVLQRRYGKVGHAGTLDPCASGLLIVLIGAATKRFAELEQHKKTYCGEMMLGITTDTYDITGTLSVRPAPHISLTRERLNSAALHFIGDVQQTPPVFSAIKLHGRKLYELSRSGIPVQPKARTVRIESFRISEYTHPLVKFDAVVHKGVYIRSLVSDFGQHLGCGATLVSLRRTRIGTYDVAAAKKFGHILAGNLDEDTD